MNNGIIESMKNLIMNNKSQSADWEGSGERGLDIKSTDTEDLTANIKNDNTKTKRFMLRVAVGTTNPCKLNAVKNALNKALRNLSDVNLTLEVAGMDVTSGVSDQPMGDEETKLGAKNRAERAHDAYKRKYSKSPHLSIGLEGGLEVETLLSSSLPSSSAQSPSFSVDSATSSLLDDNISESSSITSQQKTPANKESTKILWCMAWMAVYGKRQSQLVDLLASLDSDFYYGDTKPIFGCAKTACFPLPPSITKLVINDGMELGHADDKVFGRHNSKHGSGTVGILTDHLIDRTEYYEHALILALMPWIRPDVYPKGFTC